MSFKYTLLQSLSSIIHHTALLPLSSLLWGSFSTTRQHHTDETSVWCMPSVCVTLAGSQIEIYLFFFLFTNESLISYISVPYGETFVLCDAHQELLNKGVNSPTAAVMITMFRVCRGSGTTCEILVRFSNLHTIVSLNSATPDKPESCLKGSAKFLMISLATWI